MSVTVNISGIPVEFPFEPYKIQQVYMEKVIECIENNTTAVLESPTGTGKTLSLLCSSLAWLKQKKLQIEDERVAFSLSAKGKDFHPWVVGEGGCQNHGLSHQEENAAADFNFTVPKIIYASRTHSQLSQACKELKRTAYNQISCSVLGARDQLCINKDVLKEADSKVRLQLCRAKVASHSCSFNNRVEIARDSPEICNSSIIDIEDMVIMGKKQAFCPYYMTKDRHGYSDIIFAPYNYLLDPVVRQSLGLNLSNSIIILDEGHNVEKVCEESASYTIKSSDLVLAIEEVTASMELISENAQNPFEVSDKKDINADDLKHLKAVLLDLEKAVQAIVFKRSADGLCSFPGDYMFELLEKSKITINNYQIICSILERVIQYLASQTQNPFARKGKALQLMFDFLSIVFSSKDRIEKIKRCYKVHIHDEDSKTVSTWKPASNMESKNKTRVLSYWCFSPGFGMDLILSQGIKALIITSGTLAPLKPLITELELDVKVSLENPHIISADQISVSILCNGADNVSMNCNFNNRERPEYLRSLGITLSNLSSIIPNGILIFFPSYPVMYKCREVWEATGVWKSISENKAIFVEPKKKEEFQTTISAYYERIQDPKYNGAIFMAVCRGKVSEGLDFADNNGRAVIIIGLPYPPLKDPRVILKKRYLDLCHSQDKDYLTGQEWYSLEATRAVNQAIGRVIRHRYDYGAIILLDDRFKPESVIRQMSTWLRDYVKVCTGYGEVVRDLTKFFKKAKNELPVPQPKIECFVPSQPAAAASTAPITSSSNLNEISSSYDEMLENPKRRKITLVADEQIKPGQNSSFRKFRLCDYIKMLKSTLEPDLFAIFSEHTQAYFNNPNIEEYIEKIDAVPIPMNLKHVLQGMYWFIGISEQSIYNDYLQKYGVQVSTLQERYQ